MALNGNVLGDLIMANISAAVAANQIADATQRQAVFRAMGNAIVTHLTTAGLVTVTVASVSGVTTGIGVSGPGAGTGVIS